MNKPRTHRVLAVGKEGSLKTQGRESAERWTLEEAANELVAQSCGRRDQVWWRNYLEEKLTNGALQGTVDEVQSNNVNSLLDTDPEWRTSSVRLPSQLLTDVHLVGFLDYGMHAREWFGMAAISSIEAASLLCQSDPLDIDADPERTKNQETGPDDFRLLLRVFLDVEKSAGGNRTLHEWLTTAKTRGCKHHSWVHGYLAAREQIGDPVIKISIEKPKGQSDGQSEPERRLLALRDLGGEAKWWKGKWKFKGIKKLVAQEKNVEHRSRSDEKTVRLDLKEAAEAESLAKKKKEIAGSTN